MNLRLLSLAAAPALLLLAACSPGQSDTIPLESIEAIVDIGQEHGFETFEELEAESDREFVLKGWDDAQLRMETRFNLDGDLLREERVRDPDHAAGMTAQMILRSAAVARDHGMLRFKEIEFEDDGVIEIEGITEDGDELNIRLDGEDFTLLSLERD
ncbi:PepSY domain-containing protein [Thioalkalivibrio sp. AKL12]|uniref:PepSY domain-containing protein n=1 Tax=Thioalkalivibrio sp. AKL12 TaxID=1158159 RepID=UPI0003758028|nr:PepSY domain-containing protein [Thioalkalivibrio sp. AKL12]